jgi:hypothetical protein
MAFPADTLNRVLRNPPRSGDPVCLLCQRHVRTDEQRLRLGGETYVHSRCATHRVRAVRAGESRLGHPN